MSVKKDCFAYSKNTGKCTVLRATHCKWEECKFYKKKDTLCNGCLNKGDAKACNRCHEARRG